MKGYWKWLRLIIRESLSRLPLSIIMSLRHPVAELVGGWFGGLILGGFLAFRYHNEVFLILGLVLGFFVSSHGLYRTENKKKGTRDLAEYLF